jgi:SAM-dependent methyltransferase
VSGRSVADRLASLYPGRTLQGYARWKLRMDPIYSGVRAALLGRELPLVDLGCGVGLLPFYLREHGYASPVIGIDFDERKIALARQAATRYRDVTFRVGDARDPLPANHAIVILDLLHYFDAASQKRILDNAARAGDVVILRQGIRDGSWRHRFTAVVDALGRAMRWMRAESLHYPTRDEIVSAFDGFTAEITPLRGRTPYNNYLFVFTRATARRAE